MPSLLPIFMIHQVLPAGTPWADPYLSITPQTLAAQIQQLLKTGHRFLTLQEAWQRILAGTDVPRAATLTFDDLDLDFVRHALPILAAARVPATVFAVAGWLREPPVADAPPDARRLRPADLKVLAAAGIEIGSHAFSHRVLTGLPDPELRQELTDSRSFLQDLLGRPVPCLAYPRGRFSPRVLAAAAAAGYACACSTLRGNVHAADDRYSLKRVRATDRRRGLRLRYATSWLYDCWNQERSRRERIAFAKEDPFAPNTTPTGAALEAERALDPAP